MSLLELLSGASAPAGASAGISKRKLDATNEKSTVGDAKKQKPLSFAEATVDKLIVEIFSDDGESGLDQKDFDKLQFEMMMAGLRMNMTNPVDFKISSISNGTIRYGVENQKSVDFICSTVPGIKPPAERLYKYTVFRPGQKPFRFFTVWIPAHFIHALDQVGAVIQMMNPSLAKVVDTATGEERKSKITVTKVLNDSQKNRDGGNIQVVIRIEEKLFQKIINKRGVLQFGVGDVTLKGDGLEKAIEDQDAPVAIVDTGGDEEEEEENKVMVVEDDGNI